MLQAAACAPLTGQEQVTCWGQSSADGEELHVSLSDSVKRASPEGARKRQRSLLDVRLLSLCCLKLADRSSAPLLSHHLPKVKRCTSAARLHGD